MSGVVKGVGKVFRKVLKVAKVVVPIALAVGAVVFTGGAALGLTLPTWGAAVTSVFGTSALGAIASGAVVSAGYGAVIGGATAALTGKSVMKGMQMGAATGAVTGGILGGATYVPGQDAAAQAAAIDPIGNALAGGGEQAATAATAGGEQTVGSGAGTITSPPLDAPAGSASTGTSLSTPVAHATKGMVASTAQQAAPAAATSSAGFWTGAAGPIAGGVLTAVGGAMTAAAAGDQQENYDRNYGINYQDFLKPRADAVANPGGRQMSELSPRGPGRWRYNVEDSEFEFVPAKA